MSRMLKVSSFAAFAAVVLMLGTARLASAADEKKGDDKKAEKAEAKGTISGTVNGADGKPVKDVTVRLFASRPRGERQQSTQAGPVNGEVFVAAPAPGGDRPRGDRPGRGQGQGGQRQQALKESKTNDKGEFTIAEVPAGEYSLAAMEGQNSARERVTVKAGETAKVTLALKPRPAGGNRGRGNQNQNQGDAPKGEGAAK